MLLLSGWVTLVSAVEGLISLPTVLADRPSREMKQELSGFVVQKHNFVS